MGPSKGKLEYSEDFETAAQREVKEECGLESSIKINRLIYISFHTYIENSKKIIKRTHWYEMTYSGSKSVFPQAEEGIEKVEWFSLERILLQSLMSPTGQLKKYGNLYIFNFSFQF